MNWDIIAGDWQQFQGKVQAQWGKLTNDQLDVISGKRTALLGLIQTAYDVTVDEAERQLKMFEDRGDLNIKSYSAKKHS